MEKITQQILGKTNKSKGDEERALKGDPLQVFMGASVDCNDCYQLSSGYDEGELTILLIRFRKKII